MEDLTLRDLLTEFDELTIALTSTGLAARVAGVDVATAATLAALTTQLDVTAATAAVITGP